ncbi:MAG TPA: helix-turn-helix domain-containing protein [Streptosporangiaceae bacterium]|nr:helix-turn-helix domain-containing protein [Streptosporangiaceae bacterium]
MPRYRLLPSPAQEAVLRDHCAHARYVWNLAAEQHVHWRPGRRSAPRYLEQCWLALARLRVREMDRRKDWAEKASTDIARRFDLIKVEDLRIRSMTRSAKGTLEDPGRNVRAKAGLNRGILRSGWGLLVRRLEDKAPGRVEKVS